MVFRYGTCILIEEGEGTFSLGGMEDDEEEKREEDGGHPECPELLSSIVAGK